MTKQLFLLLGAFALIGCEEESSPEELQSARQTASVKRKGIPKVEIYQDENIKREDTNPEYAFLTDEAVEESSTEVRNEVIYLKNKDEPFSGWLTSGKPSLWIGKMMFSFTLYKDGKWERSKKWDLSGNKRYESGSGPTKEYYENGHLIYSPSVTLKDGTSTQIYWWENGQKQADYVLKDGFPVSCECWDKEGFPITSMSCLGYKGIEHCDCERSFGREVHPYPRAGTRVRGGGITAAMPSIPTMTRICLGLWKIYWM